MMLTIRELSERWKISEPTIRRMMNAGQLAFVKIRRSTRFSVEEVLRIERWWSGAGVDRGDQHQQGYNPTCDVVRKDGNAGD